MTTEARKRANKRWRDKNREKLLASKRAYEKSHKNEIRIRKGITKDRLLFMKLFRMGNKIYNNCYCAFAYAVTNTYKTLNNYEPKHYYPGGKGITVNKKAKETKLKSNQILDYQKLGYEYPTKENHIWKGTK